MNRQLTELEIIEGLKTNDARVCRYLFDQYYTPLLYFAEKLTDNREEAEDIVVNIFNSFWNLREGFMSSINIKAFLYISVRNRCLNYIKYLQREKEGKRELLAHLQSIENQPEQIDSLLVKSDFLNIVFLKVQHLPEKCRNVFILTYFEGLKASEIAKKLNITVSTVTSQRSKALKHLRENMTGESYFLACLVLFCSISPEIIV